MNNSSVSTEELLQKLNDEMVELFIPVIVFTCINMVTGLVGNSMVCYYYGFKTKRTPTSVFILALAVYDLIACTVTMPQATVLLVQYYTYNNRNACKSLQFISYFVVVASVLTLPVIAIDRYRHICVSGVNQTTVKDAIKQCVIVATIAVLISWPASILYDIEVAPLPNDYGLDLQSTSCSLKTSLDTYTFVQDLGYLISCFVCIIILVVLYFRICKVIHIHRKQFGRSENQEQSFDNHSQLVDKVTAKVTIGLIVITAVFFLSFIPRLSLLIWRARVGKRESQFLSGAGLVWFQLGRQSYMLNSSLNPWIYGIFNSQFRQFYYRKLCAVCRRPRDTTLTI